MDHVSDRVRNPFGLVAPCPQRDDGVVYGYGDPSADFHLIGDFPGAHGGSETGIPFTRSAAGRRVQSVLHAVGFAATPYSDHPEYEDLFVSYRHMCPTADGSPPSDDDYADLERYFDAELRAVNAHVLLPVGRRPTDHVLRGYTTRAETEGLDMRSLHATEVRGRGFMVVPVRDPREWADGDRERLVQKLTAVCESDYRQTKGVATLVG